MTHLDPATRRLMDELLGQGVVEGVWGRKIDAWSAKPGSADAKSIASRLGWLDTPQSIISQVDSVRQLGSDTKARAIEAVYLLGMGGSSLCAEVYRHLFGRAKGWPELFVLDTTDEGTISATASRMDPARTAFIVASKSGGTVEVASMERFFWERMTRALGAAAGSHFVAITDPGTALQALAESRGYSSVFLNPPDIGGRFSALSLFGLVPAGLIGVPLDTVTDAASAMADGCRQHNQTNPGLQLGAFVAAGVKSGRDKLTLALSPTLASLGLWIEQLIAESTGKHGTGALPVVDEPLGHPTDYDTDRAFVAISTEVDSPDLDALKQIEAAGHPVLRLTTRVDGLGAEFFRWEFATAVAGVALAINPFDEPNVSEAKEKTKALLAAFAAAGSLPEPRATAEDDATAVFSRAFSGSSPAAVVRAALTSVKHRDYVAFLSYVTPGADVASAIGEARTAIRSRFHAATTIGIGPRYLHSTGQYHKGGPNTMVAFVLTADDESSTPIPGMGYSFSVLKRAQALGDVETLEAHERRTVRIHVKNAAQARATIERLFADAL